jgi:hypothetical protein
MPERIQQADKISDIADALPVRVLRFTLAPEEPVRFTTFPGITIRGALCSVMKGLVCVARQTECRECYVQRRCAFARLFVSMPPEDAEMMKLYPSAPHPFVLRYPDGWGRRAEYSRPFAFKMYLFGDAADTFPFVARTLERLQQTGLGRDRSGFTLQSTRVETYDGEEEVFLSGKGRPAEDLPAFGPQWEGSEKTGSRDLCLQFLTPVRVKRDGRPANPLPFDALFANLCRRLSALAFFYGAGKLDWDFGRLVERAGEVSTKRDETEWERFERYSGRQNRKMPFGGLLGAITYGDVPEELARIVRFGRLIGAGRHSAFGLGEYEVLEDE